MFEQTWMCEPNDRVSNQGFGVENIHKWWLSRCQECKKLLEEVCVSDNQHQPTNFRSCKEYVDS